MHDEMLTYGLKEGTTNKLLHIDSDEVPNGLDCGCVCPHCKHPLIARNGGSKRTHHFAHYKGAECGKARMTALHMLAQNIISRDKKVMLPNYQGEYYEEETKGIKFDEVKLEETYQVSEGKQLRPDCIGIKYDSSNKAHYLWVEIYVTHEVKEDKEKYIRASANACIEIDLSDMLDTDYSEESVMRRIQAEKDNRRWICCPKFEKIEAQRKLQAEQEEAERQRKEKEYREHQQEILNELRKEVTLWFETKQSELAKSLISRIRKERYSDEIKLMEILAPGYDFVIYVKNAPSNEDGKNVLYTLLRFYYHRVSNTNYQEIKRLLKQFQYNPNNLSHEDNVKLEELISLKILYILELNRKKYRDVDFDDVYKTCIKKYILEPEIRNDVLMVVSVLYHHVVGSDAANFGELTNEIILHHPSLAQLYLNAIKNQDKYLNDYTYEGRDMFSELKEFVKNNKIEANVHVNNILQECFDYVVQPKQDKRESSAYSEPFGFAREFAGQNINNAWEKLNQAFNNQ